MERDPIDSREAHFTAEMVAVTPDVRLKLMRWRPSGYDSGPPILFVAGWVSAVSGWADLLRPLVARRTVYYLETREKPSADVRCALVPDSFSISRIAEDVATAVSVARLPIHELVAIGSSLGATALLEAMKGGRLLPRAAFLIGPTCEFRFPSGSSAILRMPAFSYHLLKHAVIAYLRLFRVDAKKEPEQMQRYRDTLLAAVPERIKLSAMSVRNYRLWPDLESVKVPVGIAHAATDTLHASADIQRLRAALPGAVEFPCPSNKHMHSAALLTELEKMIAALN